MMDHAHEFTIEKMSEIFTVSRSGYYLWMQTKDDKEVVEEALDDKIKQVFEDSRCNYGSPRISQELGKMGCQVSKSKVARRMNELKMVARRPKRYKHTTDSNHDKSISPNVLDRRFEVSELNKYWVSDITYIQMKYSFVYLTTVLDLADRMVVGWSLSNNMTDKDTTIAAMKKALSNRKIEPGLVFHSDRGSQYASDDFRKLLKENQCVQSMSGKGNCWDNAVAESFFKTIKVESLNRYKFETIDQVYSAVFNYIDGWYNTVRIHSSLMGMSPLERNQFLRA